MEGWHLSDGDLKRYPHFDSFISTKEAQSLATDVALVARHKFFPFIRFRQRWNRFSEKGEIGKVKERPIRYAARRDAYIFSYYRHILSQKYEIELDRLGLGRSILAYRPISLEGGKGGKCNIHFCYDAIQKIRELNRCCVIALDISSFFESLDHKILKELWCRMLDVTRLPDDHFQVFKAITQYAVVDKIEAYERLGYFGLKRKNGKGLPIEGYLKPHKDMPRQLCLGNDFREKIAGGNGEKSIIIKNYKPYGIPQGAPIPDLLANLYLIDFDKTVAGWAIAAGGTYYRYSDDILIIVPGNEAFGKSLMARTRELITKFGPKLFIKEAKSSLLVFEPTTAGQKYELILGEQGKNGIEYLGFRYDGQRVWLRDVTLSNLRRKIARAAKRRASVMARRYPDKNASQLMSLFDYEELIRKFGKVERFGEVKHEFRKWTFWTYAKRATKVFGAIGKPISRQLRNLRTSIKYRADQSLMRAVDNRDKREAKTKHAR